MKKNLTVRIGAIVMVLMVAFFSILPDLVSAEGDNEEATTQEVVAEAPELDDSASGEEEAVVPEPGESIGEPEETVPEPEPGAPSEGEEGTEIQNPEQPDDVVSTETPEDTENKEDTENTEEPGDNSEDGEDKDKEDTEGKLPDAEAPVEPAPPAEAPDHGDEPTAPKQEEGPADTTVVADAGEKDTIEDYLEELSGKDSLNQESEDILRRLKGTLNIDALAELFDNDDEDFVIEGTTLVGYKGTDAYVAIPGNVTAIGDGAFAGNTSILAVGFPANLQSIGSSAFNGCSNLVSVSIPDSVTSVGTAAFANCSGLAEVYTGAGAGVVASNEFANCISLQSIAIPEGISAIASGAFAGCSNLGSISLPSTMASMDASAFSGDVNLASISVASGSYSSYDGCVYTADGSQLLLCPQGKTGISFAPGMRSVATGAFSGCNYLLSAVIPNAAGSIETNAFSGSAIKAVTIPAGVTSIGSQSAWTPNVVYGYKGSAAETWARQSNYVFESLDGNSDTGNNPAEEHIEDPDSGSGDPGTNPGGNGAGGASKPGTSTPGVNLASSSAGAGTTAAISKKTGNGSVASTPKTGVEDYGIYFLFGGIFLIGIAMFLYSRKLRIDGNR